MDISHLNSFFKVVAWFMGNASLFLASVLVYLSLSMQYIGKEAQYSEQMFVDRQIMFQF